MNDVKFRWAMIEDLDDICDFVDVWLSGRKCKERGRGFVSDYFVPRGRQIHFIRDYKTLLAVLGQQIIGWAVLTNKGILIHLLIRPDYRGHGIGRRMVQILQPDVIRSKTDQSSGNPEGFYTRLGFKPAGDILVGRRRNIQLFRRVN